MRWRYSMVAALSTCTFGACAPTSMSDDVRIDEQHSSAAEALTGSLVNPIIPAGGNAGSADPFVTYSGGYYYYVKSDNDLSIAVYKSTTLSQIFNGSKVTVFTPPAAGTGCSFPTSQTFVWAPELYNVGGSWYIYFTSTDCNGVDGNHSVKVLKANSSDPAGSYTYIGAVTGSYAIDPAVANIGGTNYLFFAGNSNIWIQQMSSPTAVTGSPVIIGGAFQTWEQTPVWREAPAVLQHGGKTFITYSTRHTAGYNNYQLGMLSYTGTNPLLASSWTNHNSAVFSYLVTGNDATSVYAPGSNSFTQSPDGTQVWMIFHSKVSTIWDIQDREVHAQPITFDGSGNPVFPTPVPSGTAIASPSGEVVPNPAASTPLTDSFASFDQWRPYGGVWTVANNAMTVNYVYQSYTGYTPWTAYGPKAIACGTSGGCPVFSDVAVQGVITQNANMGQAGFIMRAGSLKVGTDAMTGYYVGLNTDGESVLIGKENNGWTQLASWPMTVTPGQQYFVSTQIIGNGPATISVAVYKGNSAAGQLMVEGSVIDNTPFLSGNVGIRAYGVGNNPSATFQAFSATMPDVAQYDFFTTNDETGNTGAATLNGATLSGGSVVMNGSSQYVALPNGIADHAGVMTISAMVNVASISNWARIFDFGSSNTNYMFLTPSDAGGHLRFAIMTPATGEQQVMTNYVFPTNTWVSVQVVIAGGTGKVYANGTLVGSATLTLTPQSLGNTISNWLGRSEFTADPYLNGSISNFYVNFSPTVRYDFTETGSSATADASFDVAPATMQGGATLSGGTVVLNGANEYAAMPSSVLNVSGATQWTISTKVNMAAANTFSRIFDFGSSTNVNMYLTATDPSGHMRLGITTSGNTNEQQILTSYTMPLNTWVTVTLVLKGGVGTLYVNDAVVGSNSSMTLTPLSMGATSNNWIGRSQYPADPYFNGAFDYFYIDVH